MNHRYPYPEKGDPHIVWFYKEMLYQGKTEQEIADKAGLSNATINKMKTQQQINFVLFKAMLEVLGYEVMIVAKEPKIAQSQTTD